MGAEDSKKSEDILELVNKQLAEMRAKPKDKPDAKDEGAEEKNPGVKKADDRIAKYLQDQKLAKEAKDAKRRQVVCNVRQQGQAGTSPKKWKVSDSNDWEVVADGTEF